MIRRIIIGLFILLIFGTAIFLLYRSGFREGNVIFKIEAPDQVSSGEEIEYRHIIENRKNFDLNNTKLTLSYTGGRICFNKYKIY